MSEELLEKPLLDHVTDLLEMVRRILIYIFSFLILLLFLPVPWLLPKTYHPFLFYCMDLTNHYMLNFDGNIFSRSFATMFGVNGSTVVLISHGWFDSLAAATLLDILMAITVLSPVIAWEVYRFIEPGLYSHEKRIVKRYMFFALALFISGVIYGYTVVMPIVFAVAVWLATLGGASLFFSIQNFYQNILIGSLATGVFFMFPLGILALNKAGIVSYEMLHNNWRYIVFAIFVIFTMITPDPTIISDIVLGLPFIVLYFFTMWLVKRSEKSKKKT